MNNNALKDFYSQLIPGIAISFCWDLIKHIFSVLWQKKITIAFTSNALVILLIILALTIIIGYFILNIKQTRLR